MSDESPGQKGKLKVFLGYAAGVGKTYQMLDECRRLQREGHDVVIGYFEPHGRQDTIAKTEGLEILPRRRVEYRGREFEEMDTPAILARQPKICAVDEFAHTNVPGSERTKRWEDVMVLLEAGIDVLTTMNIQHLESLHDQILEITGVQVRETIPDWVVKQADEVVLIDLPPQALLNRLHRGVIYGPDKAHQAMKGFFKEPTLAALREMALLQTAHEVDSRQVGPVALDRRSLHARSTDEQLTQPNDPHERILIHITESPATAALIRRGKRVADYLNADCFAVCVLRTASIADLPKATREALEQHLDFARKLHIEAIVLQGQDVASSLVDFARRNRVTQAFLAKPPKRTIPLLTKMHMVMKVVRLAKDMQVTLVADRRRAGNP